MIGVIDVDLKVTHLTVLCKKITSKRLSRIFSNKSQCNATSTFDVIAGAGAGTAGTSGNTRVLS